MGTIMKLAIIAVFSALLGLGSASATPILSGFNSSQLQACDDCSSAEIGLGFTINFIGRIFSSVYVNNNGNVTFGAANSGSTPEVMHGYAGAPIIAPYYSDVDTRIAYTLQHPNGPPTTSGKVTYGQGHYTGSSGLFNRLDYNDAKAFGVTWRDVPGWELNGRFFNTFQLLIIENEQTPNAFEIMFNIESIQWTTSAIANGVPGTWGYSDGKGLDVDALAYDGNQTRTDNLRDDGSAAYKSHSISFPTVAGRYAFLVATDLSDPASIPEPETITLLLLGLIVLAWVRRPAKRD
jgi:hypothetical protein